VQPRQPGVRGPDLRLQCDGARRHVTLLECIPRNGCDYDGLCEGPFEAGRDACEGALARRCCEGSTDICGLDGDGFCSCNDESIEPTDCVTG